MSFRRRRKRGSLVRYMTRRPRWERAHVDGDVDDNGDRSSGVAEMAAAVEVEGGICTDARALCG